MWLPNELDKRIESGAVREKGAGGVCLNGVYSHQTMLYSAKTYENALHGEKYGVFAETVRFGPNKIVSAKIK